MPEDGKLICKQLALKHRAAAGNSCRYLTTHGRRVKESVPERGHATPMRQDEPSLSHNYRELVMPDSSRCHVQRDLQCHTRCRAKGQPSANRQNGYLLTVLRRATEATPYRRTTGAVRGILERTRGDFTVSVSQCELEQRLAELQGRLEP